MPFFETGALRYRVIGTLGLLTIAVIALVSVYVILNRRHPIPIGANAEGCTDAQGTRIALTFDADMTPKMLQELHEGRVEGWYDGRIIAILNEHAVPATIFVTGLWAKMYPNIVEELARNPLFEIENHGFSHTAFRTPCYHLPAARDKSAEILEAQEILRELTAKAPRFFRFPGGCYSPDDVELVRSYGLRVIEWDVNSGDAFSTDQKGIVERVLREARSGSIVLMHLSDGPNAPETARALPSIIQGLEDRGFSFVTIAQLIGQP